MPGRGPEQSSSLVPWDDYYRKCVPGCYVGASSLGHHVISISCCNLRSPESEKPGPRQSSTRTIDPLRVLNSLLLRTSSPVSLSSSCCRLPARASRLAALSLPLPGRAWQLCADISSPKRTQAMATKLWFLPSSRTWVLGQVAHEAACEGHSEEQLTEPSPFARHAARLLIGVLSFDLHIVPVRSL